MKKHFSRVLAMVLVLVTLVATFAVPASAAGYYMACSIYYKDEAGNQVASTKTFSMNAADTTAQNKQYASPSVAGYSLKNSSDAYVTYLMMDKSFGSSHYTREGSASYTVYYVKNKSTTIYYKYSDGSTASASRTLTGNPNNTFSVTSPTITGYTPNKTSCSGKYGSASQTVYYYEKTYTISFNANGGSGAPGSQTKKYFSNLTLSSTKPTRTGYTFQENQCRI